MSDTGQDKVRNIAILGSTGSIGVNALKVINDSPDRYRAIALTAGRNIDLLLSQIEKFQPKAVAVLEKDSAEKLKRRLPGGRSPDIYFGNKGFVRMATLNEVDTVVSCMTGAAGLIPTFEAVKAGKDIALANKETMVMAGPLVMAEAKRRGVSIKPVDSEHSAIFQSLQGHHREDVRRVVLTASGGPFRNLSHEEMAEVTPAQALEHPNWDMGQKITIDSATMMNKGLEIIEAKWLFDLSVDQINVLIHPESIIHSMVEYKDGAVIAQLAIPDMTIPISYALSFPYHIRNSLPPLDLEQIGRLTFERPDKKRFRCIDLALEAARLGGSMQAVLNGANEVAVESFLKGEIGFLEIPILVEKVMNEHNVHSIDTIEMVLEADRWARNKANDILKNRVADGSI
jgi:1-deoxy-D-xylulose-5-phosphate reductoisomerase